MKDYVKPVFEVAQAASSEKIAAPTSCTRYGSCFWGKPYDTCEPGWNYYSYSGPTPW